MEDVFIGVQIDTSRPIPYHTQVYQSLERIITSNLKPGDKLPSEPKLSQLFGVSRPVIRQALNELAHYGFVHRVMGKGTFVAEPKINEGFVGQLTGFYEDMVGRGYTVISNVLQQKLVSANAKIARNLNMNTGEDVIAIKRLRFVNGVPIVLVTTYLPRSLCPEVIHTDLTHQSLYDYLKQTCNLEIARGKRIIEAVLADEEQARLLEIAKGDPLLQLDSLSYLEDGTAVEYYQAVHRCDRTRFEVSLVRA